MNLPRNSIGITDVLAYRDCPRRFEFGMRRHTEAGEHPEAQGPSTAYGSAIHAAIAYAETHDASDEEAIQHAFNAYGRWLEPDDIQRLHTDLGTYRVRDYLGVRPVAVEREVNVPLFTYKGTEISFRGTLDRVYQRLDNPSVFIHIDYKSSRWPKSEEEVHKDPQLWAYNFAIHEFWPECETLIQAYDQLAYGVVTTRKSPAQRGLVREWLCTQITTILDDNTMQPTKNRWCAWCPIMESCPIVADYTDFALATIAALAPERKQGRRITVELDPERFGQYVARLEEVGRARGVLERYEESVKSVLREMTTDDRAQFGYELRERSRDVWPAPALRAAHEILGEDFYEVVGLTKTAVQRMGDGRVDAVLALAERQKSAPALFRTTKT